MIYLEYLEDVVYGKLAGGQVVLQKASYPGEYACSLSGMEDCHIVQNEDGVYMVETLDKAQYRYDTLGRLDYMKTDKESVTVSYGEKYTKIIEGY